MCVNVFWGEEEGELELEQHSLTSLENYIVELKNNSSCEKCVNDTN